jgi:hypothetical protein
MMINMSLPEDDIRCIDEGGAQTHVLMRPARSPVVDEAIMMLRSSGMEAAYTATWADWTGSEDAAHWDTTSSDGLADAPT